MFPAVRACSPGRRTWAGPAREPDRPILERADAFRAVISFLSHCRPSIFTRAAHMGRPGAGTGTALVHMLSLRVPAVRACSPGRHTWDDLAQEPGRPDETSSSHFSPRIPGRLQYDTVRHGRRIRADPAHEPALPILFSFFPPLRALITPRLGGTSGRTRRRNRDRSCHCFSLFNTRLSGRPRVRRGRRIRTGPAHEPGPSWDLSRSGWSHHNRQPLLSGPAGRTSPDRPMFRILHFFPAPPAHTTAAPISHVPLRRENRGGAHSTSPTRLGRRSYRRLLFMPKILRTFIDWRTPHALPYHRQSRSGL